MRYLSPLFTLSLTVLVSAFFFPSAVLSAPAAGTIQGEVRLSKSIKAKIAETAALYVIARPDGKKTGMPLAVKRFSTPLTFPIRFELGAGDMMMGGTDFAGKMTISARLAMQGSASPPQAGDIEATRPANVEVGTKKPVLIELDHVR